jgi:hypothetical protein
LGFPGEDVIDLASLVIWTRVPPQNAMLDRPRLPLAGISP